METEVTVGGVVRQIMYVSANRSDVSLCSTVLTIWFSLGTKTICHGIILTSQFNNIRVGPSAKPLIKSNYYYESLISKNKLFIETKLQCCSLLFFLLNILSGPMNMTDAIAAIITSCGAAIVVLQHTVASLAVHRNQGCYIKIWKQRWKQIKAQLRTYINT